MEIKRNINVKELCDKIINGNVNALSRAITLIESNNYSDRAIANKILLDIEMNYKKIKKTITPLEDQLKNIGAPKIKK